MIMVWSSGEGFVIALTYGPEVDWYRNLLAAGHGTVLWHRRAYVIEKPEPIDSKTALQAFPPFLRMVLRMRDTLQFVHVNIVVPELVRT
jgi:hypothetical protein